MFTKNSRYYNLDDIVVNNKNNRQINSKSIRQIEPLSGIFQHVIDDNDRLDLLASKYYSQPVNWGRICDANPEFKSPLDLLGKSSVKTYRYSVLDSSLPGPFAWLELTTLIDSQIGVDAVVTHDDLIGLDEQIVDILGNDVTVTSEVFDRYFDVRLNTQLITPEETTSLLAAAGIELSAPMLLGRVGKKITIPAVR